MVTGIDHIVLRVGDMEAMLDFYCGMLCLSIEREQRELGLVQLRAGRALIDLVSLDGPLGKPGGGAATPDGRNLDHFAIGVFPWDEVAIRQHLAKHSVAVLDSGQRYGATGNGPSLYVADPEGNVLELKRGDPLAPLDPLFDLAGKVALVTGGGSGIGLGIARGLARCGAALVIAARGRERGEAAVAALRDDGATAQFLPLDLADPESCAALLPAAIGLAGRLDILVNNGGTNIAKPPQDVTLDDWRAVLDTNLTGAFLLCQGAYPEFRRLGGGKIVNIGSTATLRGSGAAVPYSASKGGIGQLTRALASAWGPDNIQVNAVLPGYIDTQLVAAARAERPGFEAQVMARTPLRRFGQPGDLAGVAVFLASAASDFVTGALIPVDGGYSSQL